MGTDHVNSSATSPHHPYFFPDFFPIFFIWNYKIYHIWQFLVFIPVTGFQCHSVPVNSGDCSGEITGISKFRGRNEILTGKFHWNGTGICRNDRILAGICGASLRPPIIQHKNMQNNDERQHRRRSWFGCHIALNNVAPATPRPPPPSCPFRCDVALHDLAVVVVGVGEGCRWRPLATVTMVVVVKRGWQWGGGG